MSTIVEYRDDDDEEKEKKFLTLCLLFTDEKKRQYLSGRGATFSYLSSVDEEKG